MIVAAVQVKVKDYGFLVAPALYAGPGALPTYRLAFVAFDVPFPTLGSKLHETHD